MRLQTVYTSLVRKPLLAWSTALGIVLLVVGCSSGSGATQGITSYIQGLAAKDRDQVMASSCASWEEQATIEVDSLELVETTLEGLTCQEGGSQGDYTLVTCQGKIIASYDAEKVELDLSKNTYLAVEEDGAWKMCGYK